MTTYRNDNTKVYWMRSFAFDSSDHCMCYKHRTKNGKPKRCGNHSCSVSLTDPDECDAPLRLYCLNCWIGGCRDEQVIEHPGIRREVEQAIRDRTTIMDLGC